MTTKTARNQAMVTTGQAGQDTAGGARGSVSSMTPY